MGKTIKLYEHLRHKLKASNGFQLPSKVELAEKFDVSIGTVSNAIRKLKDEGSIRTIPGKGAFLLKPAETSKNALLVGMAGSYLPSAQASECDMLCSLESNIVLQGIRKAAQADACTLAMLPWTEAGLEVEQMRKLKLNGLLVLGGLPDEELLKAARCGMPAILANYPVKLTSPLPFIDFDASWAIAEAVGMLKAQGRKRIAFIAFNGHSVPGYGRWLKERFIVALADCGLPFEEALHFEIPFPVHESPASLPDACALFSKENAPDALLCWDQRLFKGVDLALKARGLQTPPCIAVGCSFDNGACPCFLQPGDELGEALLSALRKRLADPSAFVSEFIKPKFIERK